MVIIYNIVLNTHMLIIAGLGNPGEEYKKTWHNIGFLVADDFAKRNNFPEFKFEKKYNILLSEEDFSKEKVILIKPQTFMNESGKAIKALSAYRRLPTQKLIVVHDDIDLQSGEIKIVKNRGAGGHKGVESIIKELKTKDFIRIRIGIKPKTGKPKNVENFVVQQINKTEGDLVKKGSKALELLVRNGHEKAMNEYNH